MILLKNFSSHLFQELHNLEKRMEGSESDVF